MSNTASQGAPNVAQPTRKSGHFMTSSKQILHGILSSQAEAGGLEHLSIFKGWWWESHWFPAAPWEWAQLSPRGFQHYRGVTRNVVTLVYGSSAPQEELWTVKPWGLKVLFIPLSFLNNFAQTNLSCQTFWSWWVSCFSPQKPFSICSLCNAQEWVHKLSVSGPTGPKHLSPSRRSEGITQQVPGCATERRQKE